MHAEGRLSPGWRECSPALGLLMGAGVSEATPARAKGVGLLCLDHLAWMLHSPEVEYHRTGQG